MTDLTIPDEKGMCKKCNVELEIYEAPCECNLCENWGGCKRGGIDRKGVAFNPTITKLRCPKCYTYYESDEK
jgi:Zn finger protein HypA/HybF involved in hydrogenase expression